MIWAEKKWKIIKVGDFVQRQAKKQIELPQLKWKEN